MLQKFVQTASVSVLHEKQELGAGEAVAVELDDIRMAAAMQVDDLTDEARLLPRTTEDNL